jgi:hypothetical protein
VESGARSGKLYPLTETRHGRARTAYHQFVLAGIGVVSAATLCETLERYRHTDAVLFNKPIDFS